MRLEAQLAAEQLARREDASHVSGFRLICASLFLRPSITLQSKRKNGSMHEDLDTTMARWRRMVATPENNEELVATQILLHDCVLLLRCTCVCLWDGCDVSGENGCLGV